jgi:hypothetical protein
MEAKISSMISPDGTNGSQQNDETILTDEASDEALEAAAELPSTKRTSTCGFGCPC